MSAVAILPLGNTGSLRDAFARLGVETRVTLDPDEARTCPRLVVPGVGHFGAYMRRLRDVGLDGAIRDRLAREAPTLAVCVGMQALTQGSEEAPGETGLGWLPVRCRDVGGGRAAFGWSLVQGAGDVGHAYFVHRYGAEAPADDESDLQWMRAAHRADSPFAAGVRTDWLLATQFHPEKSGQFGAQLLRDWLDARQPAPNDTGAAPRAGLCRRVIPCLDVKHGQVVKGERFVNLVDCGDPAEAARRYEAQGADELVMLDIGATPDNAPNRLSAVRSVAAALSIPLAVGGGVRRPEDAEALFDAGADKVSVNTAAVHEPALLGAIAARYGSQACVLAIDAAWRDGAPLVTTHGGREVTGINAVDWAHEAVRRGAGEILLTSVDRDGSKQGYDQTLLRAFVDVDAPVIASGGYGEPAHAPAAIQAGADAVLLAGCLHRGETTVADVKSAMARAGMEVRQC